MFWPQQMQQKIIDENMRREEVEPAWLEVPGSQVQFQSTKTNIKMYMSSVIMTNRGKITGTIYEYKPMFNIFMYTAEQKKLNIHLNQSHCGLFAALLDMLIQPSTINAVFTKSISMGWLVKPEYVDKVIISKVFSNSLSVDIAPTADERKLQAFKFSWRKNDTVVSVNLTTGEVKYFMHLLYSFISNAPLYVSTYEMKSLSNTVSMELAKIETIQQMQVHNAELLNNMKNSFEMFESNIKRDFATAVASAVATVNALARTQTSPVVVPVSAEETISERLVESSKDEDGFEEQSDVEDIIDDQIKEMKLDVSELVVPEVNPEDDDEAGEVSYFVDPEKLIHTDLAMMEGVATLKDLLNPENKGIESLPDNSYSINVNDLIKKDNESFSKSGNDQYAIRVGTRFGVVFKDDESTITSSNEQPLNSLYPDEAIQLITPETCKSNNIITRMPDEKQSYMKSCNIDAWLSKLKSALTVDIKEDSLLPMMIESSFFHKGNLSGMLINRGRTGIPATSSLHSIACFAAAYDQIENLTPEKNNHTEKLRIAVAAGMDVLNCLVENVDTDGMRLQKDVYKKYMKALTKTLVGKECMFGKELFALDKMLLGETYEYSFFDMKMDLTNKEQQHLLRAMMDIFLLLYYARKEHILFNSQTTPNIAYYDTVNGPMFRFVRAMMMNLAYVNMDNKSFFGSCLPNIVCFESVVKRFCWDSAFFYDAVATILTWDFLIRKYIVGHENDVDDLGFISNTEIYKGLPCEEIYQKLLKS